jgi:uncharacterized Zn finger protein (UPF0148 family)
VTDRLPELLDAKALDLTTAERSRFAELEDVVARGLETFVQVGLALAEIRDSRLYRETHGTFEDYCRERWGFTDRRARQLVATAGIGTMVPVENERQARELLPVLRDEDEQAVVNAWRDAKATAEAHGKRITTKVVRNAVDRRVRRLEREQAAETRQQQESLVTCAGCGRRRGSEEGWSYLWSRNGACVHGENYCPTCATEARRATDEAVNREWEERRRKAERERYAQVLEDYVSLALDAGWTLDEELDVMAEFELPRDEARRLARDLELATGALTTVSARLRKYGEDE